MPKYRKKPIEIEAFKFIYGAKRPYPDWLQEAARADILRLGDDGHYYIKTLENCGLAEELLVSDGDFIIQGVEGELYPCKSTIFEKTYDLVTD
ncbi:hypothetical protein [Rhizobium rhizogenes]|uniref:hypothetical protein n=1 Tax=Rhizobium rhizogenes TaxID=359 RepID=UPI000DDED14E|nr:hypothetical protein [Rhizobium rhizogenes]NTF67708.1 hypothetical protein [Rhizobium rhizogenes]